MATPPLVEQIARYAAALTYDDLSSESIDIAKWLIYDSLGTGLGGYQRELGRKAASFGAQRMPGALATILGDGRQSSLEGAAFANGTMIKILGMDDSHRSASHIASQVIPAALAMGERHAASGRELLIALVAAYDLAVRVGRSVRNAQRERGFDVKGTVGTIAAALAAGLCAGVDANTLTNAMALASDLSSGTEQYVYESGTCETKDLIAGFAARNGVFATRLAMQNFYGPQRALDGEYGFFRAFGDGFDPADFNNLGEHFAITTTAFKPHGGCRHTHQAVDAVQQLLDETEIAPNEIERVTVGTYRYATQPSFRVDPDPPSRAVAGLSIRVATAIALVRHSAWPEDFDYWDDPQVRRLRHLIDIDVDPEIQATYPETNGCRVRVTLRDGNTYEGFVSYAKGEPEFRMSERELREKFRVLSRQVLSEERAAELHSHCAELELLPEIAPLLELATADKHEER